MVHIYVCRYSVCILYHYTILFCHWSLCDSKLTHNWHLLCCFPHDMRNSTHSTLLAPLEHTQLSFSSHQLREDSLSTCKTVESHLSRTSSNLLLTNPTFSPCPPTFPLDMLANVPVYLWWATSSASVHISIVHPHTFVCMCVHTYLGVFTIMHMCNLRTCIYTYIYSTAHTSTFSCFLPHIHLSCSYIHSPSSPLPANGRTI